VLKIAGEVFSKEAIDFIVTEIEKNDGQEVAILGNVDRNGIVCEVEALAYGNSNAAPVAMMETLQCDVLIHNHPSDEKSPHPPFERGSQGDLALRASEADINLASQLANKKIGFYIIDNACKAVNVIFKPEARYYLEENEVEDIFKEKGLLSKNIAYYEPREEQLNLVRGIINAVNASKILISEAGTGTGKSLSYLIPASIWALQNKKRVIVSTQTINLQQQIFNKDMHIVEKVVRQYLNKEIHYSVLIGKGNYLCKKKLTEIIRDREKRDSLFTSEEEYEIIFEIEKWSRNCQEGTINEFGGFVRDEVWEEIACDSASCSKRKCVFYSDCFYYRARMEAEKSNLIIANHSLTFSSIDEESRRSSLPFFSGIIFDEAHHAEDVALKSLSQDFSIQSLLYHLRKIYSFKGGKAMGLLPLLEKKSRLQAYAELQQDLESLTKEILGLERNLTDFIFTGSDILKPYLKESSSVGVDEEFIASVDFERLFDALSEVFNGINRFLSSFEFFASRVKEISVNREGIDVLSSISYRATVLSEAKNVFDLIFNKENEIHFVKWIEVSKKNIKFFYSPLEVGDFLANSLFSRKDFTIFTSATLMINDKFDYFKNSVGLPIATNKEKLEMNFPSPFDYQKQAEIYILEEKLDHSSVTKEKTELVKELCMMSEGGALVLFTSYYRLNEMFGLLKKEFQEFGLLPLKQGEAPRDELLSKMGQYSNVVLFATSSFWEGIDIQGDNLRCVIIEKLPFDSPADPIFKAKVKLLKSRDLNPFMTYGIPRAVLRLKQGIGRLIRSKTDKGIIAIMDERIKSKRYSSIFLNSLPPAKIIYGNLSQIVREAESFFVNRF
jgi:ATP-dependent DNA helicase DinG